MDQDWLNQILIMTSWIWWSMNWNRKYLIGDLDVLEWCEIHWIDMDWLNRLESIRINSIALWSRQHDYDIQELARQRLDLRSWRSRMMWNPLNWHWMIQPIWINPCQFDWFQIMTSWFWFSRIDKAKTWYHVASMRYSDPIWEAAKQLQL